MLVAYCWTWLLLYSLHLVWQWHSTSFSISLRKGRDKMTKPEISNGSVTNGKATSSLISRRHFNRFCPVSPICKINLWCYWFYLRDYRITGSKTFKTTGEKYCSIRDNLYSLGILLPIILLVGNYMVLWVLLFFWTIRCGRHVLAMMPLLLGWLLHKPFASNLRGCHQGNFFFITNTT